MFKKAMMLTVAAAAIAALAIPGSASAKFQHNGGDLAQNVDIEVTGQSHFEGEVGGVTCVTDSTAQLLAGQTTITIKRFEVDPGQTVTQRCSVDSTLEFLGCTDVNQVTVDIGTPGNHWVGHVVQKTTIDVTTKTIQNHLHGGIFCPKTIQLTPGTVHIKTSSHLWGSGVLEGTLQAHTGAGDQSVTITGQGNVSPAGTYGSL